MSAIHDSIPMQSIQDQRDKIIADIQTLSSQVFTNINNLLNTASSDEDREIINNLINIIPTHGYEDIMMKRLHQASIIYNLLTTPCVNPNNKDILYFIINEAIMRFGYGWDEEASIWTHGAQIIVSYPNDIYKESGGGWWYNTTICGNVLRAIYHFIKDKYIESDSYKGEYDSDHDSNYDD